MTDAPASVQRMHEKLDAFLADLLAADRSGKAVDRWCEAQAELHEVVRFALRKRHHGTATFVAPISGGLPCPHQPIEAGFTAKIKV
jgi:hypothetical protein